MDNLTHTLIGFIAGESVARASPVREPGLPAPLRRSLFVTLAAVGGNLPDLDLLYSYRDMHHTPDKLRYMLQHRGYTHTVVGCLVLVALLYTGAEWWLRRKHIVLTRRDRLELAGLCMFGTFLHLGMDFLNSYGVHPFWPVQDRWVYGDSVFIVEPLYWAAAAPLVFVAVFARVPGERVIDHVLTPAPMDPLCWSVLLLETRGDRYVVRGGVVSDAPGLIPAARCRGFIGFGSWRCRKPTWPR